MTLKTRFEDPWRAVIANLRRGLRRPFGEDWKTFSDPERVSHDGAPPAAWWPDDATRQRSNLVALQTGLGLENYDALHRFSVEEPEAFWSSVLKRLGIIFDVAPQRILDLSRGVRSPSWLPGARFQITRSCFTAAANKTAILYGREDGTMERTSYEALEREVNQFARSLSARGIQPGDGVALYMPMTPECVVAYLGTVRAGCRVVSIADSFSSEQLHGRLEIAGARVLVTVAAYQRAGREIALYPKVRDAVARFDAPPRVVVIDAGELEGDDVGWPEFVIDGRDGRDGRNGRDGSDDSDDSDDVDGSSDADDAPAFVGEPYHVTNVLFSSGTTGEPKAIPWTQLTPLKAAMDAHFHQDVHSDDVVCWPTNIGWMMGPWLIYASLINDATLALYEGAPTGRGFTEFVRNGAVTVLGVVPSIVRHWRSSESVEAGAWPDLRLFSSTGEAGNAQDSLWLMSRADYRAPIIEYLGGTEIGGGHLTGTVLHAASPATFTTAALGIDVIIVDEEARVVPEGAMGELFLVPPALGLSQELLNRDHEAVYYEGTPVGPNGEVLRRHGDHIAKLAGGYFKAQGRADDTMNLGGIKVGSIELERVVNEHTAVRESAAVSVPPDGSDNDGAEQLVIYVVLEPDAASGVLLGELSNRIAKFLNPLFKVRDVVVVDALPRTASNKIMRRRLREDYAGSQRH